GGRGVGRGPRGARGSGAALPFLGKMIAAAEPLSIQCHPDAGQARAGFERENRLGIAMDAFERNYRDPNHKPELVVAFTRFVALKGFRPIDEISGLLAPLDLPLLATTPEPLPRSRDASGLGRLFSPLMSLGREERGQLVQEAATAAAARCGEDPAYEWTVRLADRYPDDAGVLGPLLLNLVDLA